MDVKTTLGTRYMTDLRLPHQQLLAFSSLTDVVGFGGWGGGDGSVDPFSHPDKVCHLFLLTVIQQLLRPTPHPYDSNFIMDVHRSTFENGPANLDKHFGSEHCLSAMAQWTEIKFLVNFSEMIGPLWNDLHSIYEGHLH